MARRLACRKQLCDGVACQGAKGCQHARGMHLCAESVSVLGFNWCWHNLPRASLFIAAWRHPPIILQLLLLNLLCQFENIYRIVGRS